MWEKGWRQKTWLDLQQDWDLLIIGGGITGAGIMRRSVQEGYRTLLVEAADFASGTSSRSSKLIHGGLRYLRNRQFNVTGEAVREREWLLKEAANLVTPLGCLLPYPNNLKIHAQFALGVVIYDLMAPKWKHTHLSRNELLSICPGLESDNARGGFLYYDAVMDDSRVVLRLIREAVADGATALNYTRAESLLRTSNGKVCGAVLRDFSPESLGEVEVKARVVINATGPWSDELRGQVGALPRLRKLRGSHLIFPKSRLNLPHAVTMLNPRDRRAMFAVPWEGVSLIGTTDLDHQYPISGGEPFTTRQEIEYILEAAAATFPGLQLSQQDVISSYSGLRPVISSGFADPSKESRAHVVWEEDGLITITGGKFTTFRIMAEQALQMALPRLPHQANLSIRKRYFNPLPVLEAFDRLPPNTLTHLMGRYGTETLALLNCAGENENVPVQNLPNLWSELRWAARTGAAEHLDDLLLRRLRVGLQLSNGAAAEMPRIRAIVQPEMGWSDEQWEHEEMRYRSIYRKAYSPIPEGY